MRLNFYSAGLPRMGFTWLCRNLRGIGASIAGIMLLGCAGADPQNPSTPGGSTSNGGNPGTIGGSSAGGLAAVAGASDTRNSTGGVLATGGVPASGGRTFTTGGIPSLGGNPATGGTSTSGGTPSNTGGFKSSGGSPGIGGTINSGGSLATGGIASGGVRLTGGTSATGGAKPTGGTSATGGLAAIGGTAATGGSSAAGPWPPSSTFKNPVIWEDLADLEVIRVNDTFYYTASTMHYSPGAPVLQSYDLVNWEYIGHSVPVLDFGNNFNLSGGNAYVKGIYASSLRYRASNKTYYWIGCINGGGGGVVYTATAPTGPWQKHSAGGCYYDVGLLVDDDDTMYVAYGNTNISVAQLGADGFTQVKAQQVYTSSTTLEGSRFYKHNGKYYILVTRPADAEYVLMASSPFGPYTLKNLVDREGSPVSGSGIPHQGGLVDTPNGDWYYMAFIDAYPGGRVPVLAPVTWGSDGFPVVQLVNGAWGATYPYPNVARPPRAMKPLTGTDTFSDAALGPEWEWNHNPDNTKWSAGGQLTLQATTLTNDLYAARNTLTHRILGPTSTATIALDYSAMKDGDQAGLALLRDSSAWVGIKRASGAYKVAMVNNLTMSNTWSTTGNGSEVASTSVTGGKIWLRVAADIRPGANSQGRFSYSTDGTQFTSIGSAFTMNNAWQFFMGYRYAIFNYATQALGGSVKVASFALTTP